MTPTKTRPHKPMLAEWTSEILSLSLSLSLMNLQVDRQRDQCWLRVHELPVKLTLNTLLHDKSSSQNEMWHTTRRFKCNGSRLHMN